jgi:hypothetical protein
MLMPRRAFIVGINDYGGPDHDLRGCVPDATAMAAVLAEHKDTEKNFDCLTWLDLTDQGEPITRGALRGQLQKLFDFDGDVLFYFSGHGFLAKNGGYLCTSDATKNDWGIPMQEVIDLAIDSRAKQIVLILDCCHAGDIANPSAMQGKGNPLAIIRENMTVIAASRDREASVEVGGHGLFTSALLDALDGGAADHRGMVYAPALFEYARRRFAGWDQCPVYKTNATDVFMVRECEPLIERHQLKQMIVHFPTLDFRFQLDPEFEPEDEHGNVKEPVNQAKRDIAHLFKTYRDVGFLKPSVPASQLYWAARRSETVELTARGKEYWWLIKQNKT